MITRPSRYILERETYDPELKTARSGPLIVLCYPNTYEAGMSSLAFHFLLRSFSGSSLRIERAFALPQATAGGAKTLESGGGISKASAILATVSYEEDYVNLLALLRNAGVPLRSGERTEKDPVVILGGSAVSANPMVMAPFAEAVALGEFEECMEGLVESLESFAHGRTRRMELMEDLSKRENIYVPALDSGSGVCKRLASPGKRNYIPISSTVVSPFAHFPDTVLIEINRSCVSACRFCMASYLYKPFRIASREAVLDACRKWKGRARFVGLVGTAVASYPGFESLCEEIAAMGFSIRLSSLRMEGLAKKTLALVDRLGVRSITFAPETASDALRSRIGKKIANDKIEELLSSIAGLRISKVKLYFMYNLPGETDGDLEALFRFVAGVRKLLKGKKISTSINPLIPKAWTPLQWMALPPAEELERRRAVLLESSRRILRETSVTTSVAGTIHQAALSMGDERLGAGLETCVRSRAAMVRRWKETGVDLDGIVHREKPRGYAFPWDAIETGLDKDKLFEEYSSMRGGE